MPERHYAFAVLGATIALSGLLSIKHAATNKPTSIKKTSSVEKTSHKIPHWAAENPIFPWWNS